MTKEEALAELAGTIAGQRLPRRAGARSRTSPDPRPGRLGAPRTSHCLRRSVFKGCIMTTAPRLKHVPQCHAEPGRGPVRHGAPPPT